ncbi:MAG: 4Fe-4S dicluster domain-containing protein [bacterium]
MNSYIISKTGITQFLDKLLSTFRVIAPIFNEGNSNFAEVKSGAEVNLSPKNTKFSPKGIFFPKTEVLINYKKNLDGSESMEVPAQRDKQILFGVRPCDVKSFTLLDKVFADKMYNDVYYQEKRKNSIIIALVCPEVKSSCFCTSVGISPFSKEGSDLFMVELGERYLVEIVSEKGMELVTDLEGYPEASDADKKKVQELGSQRESEVKRLEWIEGCKEKLNGFFDNPYWEKVYEKCLGCAACTFFCPTCHCFDIQDEKGKDGGQRIRLWDTCMFSLFTKETSGHNPRHSGKERIRQRVMHKFNYFLKNYGDVACVGCGRCVQECPVNMDVREILGQIVKLT